MSALEITIIGCYVVNAIIITILFLRAKESMIQYFFLFLAAALMTVSNVPIIFYNQLVSNPDIYYDLSYQAILNGVVINFVFIVFWELGFLFFYKSVRINEIKLISQRSFQIGLILLFVAFSFYLYYYLQDYSYAHTKNLYDGQNVSIEGKLFGIIGIFKSLYIPINAALLILHYKRRNHIGTHGIFKNKFVISGLWMSLLLSPIIGLTQDLQRGDVVRPVLLILIILMMKGITPKRILTVLSISAFGLLLASPFMDLLRLKSLYNKEITLENLKEITTNKKRLEYVNVSDKGVFSFENFINQLARKNIFPKTSGALAQYANREGFVYLKTFPSIVTDILPRFIYPKKPFPLSTNGTKASTAMAISAIESGRPESVFWEVGGGTLYWQFWWIGVIFGGAIVGGLWSVTLQYALSGKSFLFLVLVLSTLSWGHTILLGIDNYIIGMLRASKPIFVLFILYIFIASAFDKQKIHLGA